MLSKFAGGVQTTHAVDSLLGVSWTSLRYFRKPEAALVIIAEVAESLACALVLVRGRHVSRCCFGSGVTAKLIKFA